MSITTRSEIDRHHQDLSQAPIRRVGAQTQARALRRARRELVWVWLVVVVAALLAWHLGTLMLLAWKL